MQAGQLVTTHIVKYANVMKEIKLRAEVINRFLSVQREALYVPTTVETVGLQFRKIFELIIFASLAANRDEYAKAYSEFARHWEAAKLVKNLRRINPEYYPHPVVEKPSTHPAALHDLAKRGADYLTEDELTEAHGRCGKLMHAANPFGRPIHYEFYEQSFPIWMTRIVNLLNNHKVHLLGDSGFWLIHMFEEGKGQEVSWYRFEPAT